MADVKERRRQALEKIARERAALQTAFLSLQPPLKRLETGIKTVASVRFYWKHISLGLGAFSALMMVRRIFFLKKKKPLPVLQSQKQGAKSKEKPTLLNALVIWSSRAWRAYRWYVKVRGWFV